MQLFVQFTWWYSVECERGDKFSLSMSISVSCTFNQVVYYSIVNSPISFKALQYTIVISSLCVHLDWRSRSHSSACFWFIFIAANCSLKWRIYHPYVQIVGACHSPCNVIISVNKCQVSALLKKRCFKMPNYALIRKWCGEMFVRCLVVGISDSYFQSHSQSISIRYNYPHFHVQWTFSRIFFGLELWKYDLLNF